MAVVQKYEIPREHPFSSGFNTIRLLYHAMIQYGFRAAAPNMTEAEMIQVRTKSMHKPIESKKEKSFTQLCHQLGADLQALGYRSATLARD